MLRVQIQSETHQTETSLAGGVKLMPGRSLDNFRVHWSARTWWVQGGHTLARFGAVARMAGSAQQDAIALMT